MKNLITCLKNFQNKQICFRSNLYKTQNKITNSQTDKETDQQDRQIEKQKTNKQKANNKLVGG